MSSYPRISIGYIAPPLPSATKQQTGRHSSRDRPAATWRIGDMASSLGSTLVTGHVLVLGDGISSCCVVRAAWCVLMPGCWVSPLGISAERTLPPVHDERPGQALAAAGLGF